MFDTIETFQMAVALKLEAAYGTAETITAADMAFYADNPKMEYAGETQARELINGTGTYGPGTTVAKTANLSLAIRFAGAGASIPAWATAVLQACRFDFDGTDLFTLTNDTSKWKSATGILYEGGKRKKPARGLMGDLEIALEAGKPAIITPTFTGTGVAVANASTPTVSSIADEGSPVWGGTEACTIDEHTEFGISKATLKLNNNPAIREHAPSGGYVGGWHSPGIPTIDIDPEASVSYDWFAKQESGDLFDVVFKVGTVAGNSMIITCTDCQVAKVPGQGDRNKKATDATTLNVTRERYTPPQEDPNKGIKKLNVGYVAGDRSQTSDFLTFDGRTNQYAAIGCRKFIGPSSRISWPRYVRISTIK